MTDRIAEIAEYARSVQMKQKRRHSMNEIERTIRELQLYVDVRWGRSNDMFNLALTALREKAEREKGCVWCNENNKVYHDGQHFHFFCSYCGKRLEVHNG